MLHISVTGLRKSGIAGMMPASMIMHKLVASAKSAPGCLHASAYKDRDTVFLVTAWESKIHMNFLESSPAYEKLMAELGKGADVLETHRFVNKHMPTRRSLRELWTSARHAMAAA